MVDDNEQAKPFRKMADNIMHNAEGAFGGAFVLVPPVGAGGVISTLLLDTTGDPAQFWSMLQTKCQVELMGLKDGARNQQVGFPQRR